MCLRVKSCSVGEGGEGGAAFRGTDGGRGTMGTWFAPFQPYVQAAVCDGQARKESKSCAVTRPAERQFCGFRVFILDLYTEVGVV